MQDYREGWSCCARLWLKLAQDLTAICSNCRNSSTLQYNTNIDSMIDIHQILTIVTIAPIVTRRMTPSATHWTTEILSTNSFQVWTMMMMMMMMMTFDDDFLSTYCWICWLKILIMSQLLAKLWTWTPLFWSTVQVERGCVLGAVESTRWTTAKSARTRSRTSPPIYVRRRPWHRTSGNDYDNVCM